MDAEDMVQEAFLRWQQVDERAVISPRAYLSTIVTRLCLDQLRSARLQREQYIGPWLPEPLVDSMDGPAEQVERADSLSLAFLVLLESLSPSERAAFLLREVFDHQYAEIANILQSSEANCRQMVARSRKHLAVQRPRFDVAPDEPERVMREFVHSCTSGDLDNLLGLLAPDVMLRSDGGGKVHAALNPIQGADRVARFMIGIAHKVPPGATHRFARVNGRPGLVSSLDGQVLTVLTVELVGDRIGGVYIVANPEKLRGLELTRGVITHVPSG
jgi:RNA polymerase sigma-70 factor (ECF subfamily)